MNKALSFLTILLLTMPVLGLEELGPNCNIRGYCYNHECRYDPNYGWPTYGERVNYTMSLMDNGQRPEEIYCTESPIYIKDESADENKARIHEWLMCVKTRCMLAMFYYSVDGVQTVEETLAHC